MEYRFPMALEPSVRRQGAGYRLNNNKESAIVKKVHVTLRFVFQSLSAAFLLSWLQACGGSNEPDVTVALPVTLSEVMDASASAPARDQVIPDITLTDELITKYIEIFPATVDLSRDRSKPLSERSTEIERLIGSVGWSMTDFQAVSLKVGNAMGWLTILDMKIKPDEIALGEEAKLAKYSEVEKALLKKRGSELIEIVAGSL